MYAYLNGKVAEKGQNSLVIDVNGVGYLLSVSMNTLQETPPVGEKMKVYTHFSVREDAVDLFGFATQEALDARAHLAIEHVREFVEA